MASSSSLAIIRASSVSFPVAMNSFVLPTVSAAPIETGLGGSHSNTTLPNLSAKLTSAGMVNGQGALAQVMAEGEGVHMSTIVHHSQTNEDLTIWIFISPVVVALISFNTPLCDDLNSLSSEHIVRK